ncbi:NDR1/HIN1-like protein 13 [Rutidosis leptorrhynchoides]|uniref:NDR1/HIN1-like protein 13 n=1 Tax=Rutidosis leptorrhynchoides TaxID=125765 RepID=UPI003A992511
MEGREYSSTDDDDDVYSNHHVNLNSDDEEEHDLLDSNDGTYVIQVPKDQIYRVPPPENAIFAEARRIAVPGKKSRCTANCIMLNLLILTLLIILIIGITLTIVDKEDPHFRIRHVNVTTQGKGKQKQHEFNFTLRSKNTNGHSVVIFEKGGNTVLSFRDRHVAKGKFPSFEQDTDSLEIMKLKLVSGSGKTLPKMIGNSINGTSNAPIKLSLGYSVPLRFKVGLFTVKSKKLSMVCNLKVKRLSKHTKILSQDCDYSIS